MSSTPEAFEVGPDQDAEGLHTALGADEMRLFQQIQEGYGDPEFGEDGLPVIRDLPMGATPGDDMQRRDKDGEL